jgi:hypothetical protein
VGAVFLALEGDELRQQRLAQRAEWIADARHVSEWEMRRYGELF